MEIQVHEVNAAAYVVAINNIWFPGSYDSEATARFAAEHLTDKEAQELQDKMNGQQITLADIKER